LFTHKYFYELTFYTGARSRAQTDSNVKCILSGEYQDTEPRELKDTKRKVFRRSGIDSFIMGVNGFDLKNFYYRTKMLILSFIRFFPKSITGNFSFQNIKTASGIQRKKSEFLAK
jgi:hypothetical protein